MNTTDNHYVSNPKFLEALKAFKQATKNAIEAGKPTPRIPDYIGFCIQKIANNVSYKHQYKNYPFREDMISDGIENCIRYIHNFNPEKSSNPFAYFTTIIIYAFWRRIMKEKQHLAIKNKMILDIDLEAFDTQEFDKDEDYKSVMKEYLQAHNESTFEEKVRKPRKKKESALGNYLDECEGLISGVNIEDLMDA